MSVVNAWVGGVTPTSARVRAKMTGTSTRLAVSTSPAFTSPTYFGPAVPTAQGMVDFTATGLGANTQYYWALEDNSVLDTVTTGRFRTFPPAASPASFTCVVSSCAGTSASADLVSVGVSNRPVFDRIRNLAPLFFVHQGDMHYRNISANDPTQFRNAWDAVLAASKQHKLYRDVPLVYSWDDHDTGGNDCDSTSPSMPAVAQVYREKVPSYPLAVGSGPIYHSFECGRVLFIVSDTRYARTPDSTPDGPSKTMLGSAQKTWMAGVLAASSAKALVWLMPTPWMGLAGDTWAGFRTEQAELIALFESSGWADRMVVVDGDNHSNAMDTGTGNLTKTGASWPVWMWGSLDSPSTGVSTQYDQGPSSPGTDRYGTIEVVDTGGTEIELIGTGFIDGTPWRTHTLTVPVGALGTTPPRNIATLYDASIGRVRLAASGLALGADHASIDRSPNARTWAPVRGGVDREVVSSASTSPALNVNPYFETNASSWVMSSGDTIARSTVRAHEGAASGLVTSDGSGASLTCTTTNSTSPAAIVANTYTASCWVYSVAGWSQVEVGLVWVDGADAVSSVTFGAVTNVAAATWTKLTVTAAAPVGTAKVGLRLAMLGTPPAATALWFDEAAVTTVVTDNELAIDDYEFTPDAPNYYRIRTYSAADALLEEAVTVTTPTIDAVWLKSLARPFLNQTVRLSEVGDVGRAFRGGVYDIVGRSAPVAVTDVRGARTLSVTVATETAEQASTLDFLLASGDVLYVQAPGDYPLVGGYFAVADVSTTRQAMPWTRRWTTLGLSEVVAPGPDILGATISWVGVVNAYGTWQDVLDAQASWGTLLELIGSPADVIVP